MAETARGPWVAARWVLAALLVAGSLMLPVVVQRSPAISGGYAPGDPITSYATTTFDEWVGTTTTIEPPSALASFEVPGGPAHGLPLLVGALALIAAGANAGLPHGASLAAGGRSRRRRCPAGNGVCQLLSFRATSPALIADGAPSSVPGREWNLGPSP